MKTILELNPRTKLMIDKLVEQCDRGFIDSDWSVDFIYDIKTRFYKGFKLTVNQLNKLEELFERY